MQTSTLPVLEQDEAFPGDPLPADGYTQDVNLNGLRS